MTYKNEGERYIQADVGRLYPAFAGDIQNFLQQESHPTEAKSRLFPDSGHGCAGVQGTVSRGAVDQARYHWGDGKIYAGTLDLNHQFLGGSVRFSHPFLG